MAMPVLQVSSTTSGISRDSSPSVPLWKTAEPLGMQRGKSEIIPEPVLSFADNIRYSQFCMKQACSMGKKNSH